MLFTRLILQLAEKPQEIQISLLTFCWNLIKSKRYQDAVRCLNKALTFIPDCSYLNPKLLKMTKTNTDFDNIGEDQRFQDLIRHWGLGTCTERRRKACGIATLRAQPKVEKYWVLVSS
ncbi:MAG: hypothetical protein V7L29_19665 [Nostoc sp.]|uniref:hypothetical protein n=1 Tax=Nostoc sp. TaxID=1180 RepID=UPI002FF1A67B